MCSTSSDASDPTLHDSTNATQIGCGTGPSALTASPMPTRVNPRPTWRGFTRWKPCRRWIAQVVIGIVIDVSSFGSGLLLR
jgi:hypothetical protein